MFKSDEYKLKSYQSSASDFIKENRKALVALPTGTGKTLTASHSIVDTFKSKFRVFWITEKVAIDDTCEAMEQFFTEDTFIPCGTIGYNFPMREVIYEEMLSGETNSLVTTYAILRNDKDYLITLARAFKSMGLYVIFVIDEASQVKNEASQNHKAARELGRIADMMIALTATPISSKLSDIHNIVKSLGTKNYMSDYEFSKQFEINQLVTEGYLFKIKGTKLYISSETDALPKRVMKAGKPYFKISWAIHKGTEILKTVLYTKRRQTIRGAQTITFPPLRDSERTNYVHDISPIIKFDFVKTKGVAYLYIPITRALDGGPIIFRSIGFALTFKMPGKRERTLESVISFRYDIAGNTIGYKNLSGYKEEVANILYSMKKSEAGDIPPSVKVIRHYETDSYTKRAVAKVYADAIAMTSVARIMIASSSPSLIMEDGRNYINSKLSLLLEDLKTEITNEPILIFSPYVKVLNFISEVFDTKKIEHAIYHGQLSDDEKSKNRNDFKTGRKNILLMSSAASKGVNLQNARVVMFFDLPYTAENLSQTAGRISRLGSKHETLLLYFYLSESESAIENCLYRSLMAQLNFINTVDDNLIDKDLLDKEVGEYLEPEDVDKFMLTHLGHSKHYYCG